MVRRFGREHLIARRGMCRLLLRRSAHKCSCCVHTPVVRFHARGICPCDYPPYHIGGWSWQTLTSQGKRRAKVANTPSSGHAAATPGKNEPSLAANPFPRLRSPDNGMERQTKRNTEKLPD